MLDQEKGTLMTYVQNRVTNIPASLPVFLESRRPLSQVSPVKTNEEPISKRESELEVKRVLEEVFSFM